MNFLLERRAGRYFMVRFYDENKQEQRGKLRVNDVSCNLRVGREACCLVVDRSRIQGEQKRYWFEPIDLIPSYY